MKKIIVKSLLFLAIGLSAVSAAIVNNNKTKVEENVVAADSGDTYSGVTPKWTYGLNDVTLFDNEGDSAFGARWPWGSGNKRIHFSVPSTLLPSDLDSIKNTTINYNAYKNAYGTVATYTWTKASRTDDYDKYRYMGFEARLLNETTLSLFVNTFVSNNLSAGDTIKINGQVRFVNAETSKESFEHVIQFDNIVFEYNGRGWSKQDDIHTLDPDTFESKNNDAWILTAYNNPAGVNIKDYSYFSNEEYWFEGDEVVTYHYADGTSENIKAGLYIDGRWHHTFFSFKKDKTGKSEDIIPQLGDYVEISGIWNGKKGLTIIFSKSFKLSYAGENWLLGDCYIDDIDAYNIETFNPNANGHIYFYFNAPHVTPDSEWANAWKSTSAIGTIEHADGVTPDDSIKATIAFYGGAKGNEACLLLEGWSTGLSKDFKASSGDIVRVNGSLSKGNVVVNLKNLVFEYTDSTNGWVVYRDPSVAVETAFDSEATNKGVLRVMGAIGYEAANIDSVVLNVTVKGSLRSFTELVPDTSVYGVHGHGTKDSYQASDYNAKSIFGIELYGIPVGVHTIVVQAKVTEKNISKTFSSAELTYTITVTAEEVTAVLA